MFVAMFVALLLPKSTVLNQNLIIVMFVMFVATPPPPSPYALYDIFLVGVVVVQQ